jgi:hypothetical protein
MGRVPGPYMPGYELASLRDYAPCEIAERQDFRIRKAGSSRVPRRFSRHALGMTQKIGTGIAGAAKPRPFKTPGYILFYA